MTRARSLLLLWVLPVMIVIGLVVPSFAGPMIFDGRIEPARQADVYSRAEGTVAQVMVAEGEHVAAGQSLVRLRSDLDDLALRAAEADLTRAQIVLTRAQDRLNRAERLSLSGSGSEVATTEARIDLELARTDVTRAEIARDLARTRLADTEIRAPIAGYVAAPQVRLGALLEVDAGAPPLFTIIALDPVQVVYQVPYADRLSQMERTGAPDVATLLRSVRLDLLGADGRVLARDVVPDATAVAVTPETGGLALRATVPNPDLLLRPGLPVRVRATVIPPVTTPAETVTK